jgi:hypothetical protein
MKVKLTIPTSLSDIKLSKYQKFIRTTKDSEDDSFIARQIICIFCDIPDNVVGQIKAKDFEDIVVSITEVLNTKPVFVDRFTLDGVRYGFIPKIEDITVDEKADLDTFLADVTKMDKAMAVMYRPITIETKRGYLVEEYVGEGKSLDVSLDVAFGANFFLSNLMRDLLSYTQNYIAAQVEHSPKVSQTLEANGVGTTAFINSLEQTFLGLNRLVSLDYTRH